MIRWAIAAAAMVTGALAMGCGGVGPQGPDQGPEPVSSVETQSVTCDGDAGTCPIGTTVACSAGQWSCQPDYAACVGDPPPCPSYGYGYATVIVPMCTDNGWICADTKTGGPGGCPSCKGLY
jgi:hypothetical protein